MMPSGHKAFLVNNMKDVELLMMHNRTYAAEYVYIPAPVDRHQDSTLYLLTENPCENQY